VEQWSERRLILITFLFLVIYIETITIKDSGKADKSEADFRSALDTQVKRLWKRAIPGGSDVQVTGNYYGVYDDRKLNVYDASNSLVAEKVLKGTDLPMYDLQAMPDGKFLIEYEEWSYVLEPETLDILYTLPSIEDTVYVVRYSGKGILYSAESQKLSKYIVTNNM